MSEAAVLVIGDVMTDVIVVPEGPLVRGSDRRATIRSRPGGSGANQAVWLASMGVGVRFAARVGADDLARYEGHFRARAIEPLLAGDPKATSGVLVTLVDPDGERSFLTDRGANLNLCAADLPLSLLDEVRMLVVSGYSFFAEGPRAAVQGVMAQARGRGIAVAVDPASAGFLDEVGPARFLDWTRGASLLLANAEEARLLSGSSGLAEQMQELGRFFDRVVIKRGAAGAAIGDSRGVIFDLPAPRVTALDSTGAGDAFAAGFIAAELKGLGVEACLKAGIEAGAEAVQRIGGQPA